MWIYKLVGIALFIKALGGKIDFEATRLDVVQDKKYYSIEQAGKLPLPEISGLTKFGDNIYAITDSGGEPAIYVINKSIELIDTILLKDLRNIDWETITSDRKGNFYIGDIGNNSNRRKNLKIYIGGTERIDSLQFVYTQQQNFPPVKEKMNFDCEAMFWLDNELHLFSKNRGKKCVKHYILQATPGNQYITPVEELKLNTEITGAAVSSNGELAVLSGYGKLYFFKISEGRIFQEPIMLIESVRFAQNEGIVFLNDRSLLICNETGKFFKISFELPKQK